MGEQKEGRENKCSRAEQGGLRQQLRDEGEEGKDNASGILKQHGDDIMLIETGRAGGQRGFRGERFGERRPGLCGALSPCLPTRSTEGAVLAKIRFTL